MSKRDKLKFFKDFNINVAIMDVAISSSLIPKIIDTCIFIWQLQAECHIRNYQQVIQILYCHAQSQNIFRIYFFNRILRFCNSSYWLNKTPLWYLAHGPANTPISVHKDFVSIDWRLFFILKFIKSFQVLKWVSDMTNIHLRQGCNQQTLYTYDWNQVDTQTSKWKIQGMDCTVNAKLNKYF